MDVDGEGLDPAVGRIVHRGDVVIERGVVHQGVDPAVGRARRLDELQALGFGRDVGGDRRRLAARRADGRHGAAQRAFERMVAFVQGARHADHPGALARRTARRSPGRCRGLRR